MTAKKRAAIRSAYYGGLTAGTLLTGLVLAIAGDWRRIRRNARKWTHASQR